VIVENHGGVTDEAVKGGGDVPGVDLETVLAVQEGIEQKV
jgi:hypothetical protein